MPNIIELQTARLTMRQYKECDLPFFAQINADPEVMAYYPNTLDKSESDDLAGYFKDLITRQSWGLWAIEIKEDKQFIGFVGLHKPGYHLSITPCIEIGWRIARSQWGKGLATEAANMALRFAFEQLELNEVYSFTSVTNQKSISLMQRINMLDQKANFEHPIIPKGHNLREHVLYKITNNQWRLNNN